MKSSDFSKKFLWGCATASYQIEGADLENGKGPSIWTKFSHTKGKIFNSQNGDVACDHYHLFKKDIELMKELGINSYRFSVSWPRILPEGHGKVNQDGVDFYSRLIDTLLENDILPFLTLYHWDMPLTLQEKIGGWESREIVNYFGDYATLVFDKFSDKVKNWITLNEPYCASHVSYLEGAHAPGIKDPKRSFNVAHNLLMSHGEAVKRFRDSNAQGQIGLTNVSMWIEPASECASDKEAAILNNQFANDWFFETPLEGKYPEKLRERLENAGVMPEIKPGDMELISTPFDFWGVNYYFRNRSIASNNLLGFEIAPPIVETTDMGWEIYPDGLEGFLKRTWEKYGQKPIYITENGMADKDTVEDGRIRDSRRTRYIKDHFEAALKAKQSGVDLRGYFIWSLMDNFEWAFGYSKRFGIIYIDYENNLKRLPKDSYYWYKDFLKEE